MEAKSRSQGLLLAGLFVVLALALWWNYGSGANGRATAGGNPVRTTGQAPRRGARAPDAAVELVALDRLEKALAAGELTMPRVDASVLRIAAVKGPNPRCGR